MRESNFCSRSVFGVANIYGSEMSQRKLEKSCKMTLRCLRRLEIFNALLSVLDPSVFHHLPSSVKSFTHHSTAPLPQNYQVHDSIRSPSATEMGKMFSEEIVNFAVTARRAESVMSLSEPKRK